MKYLTFDFMATVGLAILVAFALWGCSSAQVVKTEYKSSNLCIAQCPKLPSLKIGDNIVKQWSADVSQYYECRLACTGKPNDKE